MRSLKITLILFSILMICIIFNIIYINRCADILTEKADAVLRGEQARELRDFWESNKEYIGISISEAQLDSISRLIITVEYDQLHGSRQELKKDVALLTDAIGGIRRYEKLSIQNIF